MRYFRFCEYDEFRELVSHRSGDLVGRNPVTASFLGRSVKPLTRQQSVASRMGKAFAKKLTALGL